MSDPSSAMQRGVDPAVALGEQFSLAVATVLGSQFAGVDPQIKPSQNASFGDFQANAAMALAKRAGASPRDVAKRIIDGLPPAFHEMAEEPTIAGPGFINIRLKNEALSTFLVHMAARDLGVQPSADTHPVVVDLCGVNVAKQMHVGHLRSTIIGDSLSRVLARLGRTVYRENHLGDWGLPIAMVLHHLREKNVNLDTLQIDDLDRAYREAQAAMTNDDAKTAEAGAKATLVRLQQGDPELLRDWHKLIDCTMRAVNEVLDMLSVHLGPENHHGESFYRDRLDAVVAEFKSSGAADMDQGALVVRFADRERPMLLQKSDGGYLYATTDLAAVRYRVRDLGATRVIYVVDARQRDHFKDLFDAARKVGWDRTEDGAQVEFTHVGFGSVLGPDRKPLKTRSGENVTLKSMLHEAIDRGTAEVKRRSENPDSPTHGLSETQLAEIGKAVGIGAVKYADLSSDLVHDYVFNLDRMIAFEGNTGPYLQYAHARICSIFAKAGDAARGWEQARIRIIEPAERSLALMVLRYGAVVADVARALEPHRLCTYLYELANAYSSFYQSCPVLRAADDAARLSRLRLSDLVRRVLANGLELLGIHAPTRM